MRLKNTPLHANKQWRLSLPAAWLVWSIVIAAILTRGVLWPHRNNCFPTHYRPAGLNWLAGIDLYQVTADTCRYSPLIHALLVPFSIAPDLLGSALWRVTEIACFVAALAWWLRAVCPAKLNATERAWILVLAIPLAIGSLNNAQSNVFVIASLLAGIAAVGEGRWNLAAAAIAFASLFKIYPAALGLLLTALYPRKFGARFFIAVAIGMALPFALQHPDYVAHQYARWFANIAADDRSQWDLSEAYRDVWLLIRLAHLPFGRAIYETIQIAAGCGIAIICLAMRSGGKQSRDFLNQVLGLSVCWMTLFGPATESSTYILLSPTLAWLLVVSWSGELPHWTRVPLTLSAVLFVGTVIAVATPYGRKLLALGTQPVAGLLILLVLVASGLPSAVSWRQKRAVVAAVSSVHG